MKNSFQILTPSEQFAEHLRGEILMGTWLEFMPGEGLLAEEYSVGRDTVKGAVSLLEAEGLLISQGAGKRRRIVAPDSTKRLGMRVIILCYEPRDRQLGYVLEILHQLNECGHHASFAALSLTELKMDVGRVARLVSREQADAWIVVGGSRNVLEWFAQQSVPTLAVFGRAASVDISWIGVHKAELIRMVVRKLVALGHAKIVFLAREERRLPNPGLVERTFLDELQMQGIVTGEYNLPAWEESRAGFRRCLDSLFATTPPSAVIFSQGEFLAAGQQHLARKGIFAPEQVSLISCDYDSAFDWFHPPIAHILWDSNKLVRLAMKWLLDVSHGKIKVRKKGVDAEFFEGGTIGPACDRC